MYHTVGVIAEGDFDILVGNDVTRLLKMKIDTEERTATYQHPAMGT